MEILLPLRAHGSQQVDARAALQLQVEHQNVGLVFGGAGDDRFDIGGRAHAFQVGLGGDERDQQGRAGPRCLRRSELEAVARS